MLIIRRDVQFCPSVQPANRRAPTALRSIPPLIDEPDLEQAPRYLSPSPLGAHVPLLPYLRQAGNRLLQKRSVAMLAGQPGPARVTPQVPPACGATVQLGGKVAWHAWLLKFETLDGTRSR